MKATTAAVVLLSVFAGCQQPANLQPLIAVAGTYALMEHRHAPPPEPAPQDGCSRGCKCNGTGVEPTGDDLSTSECRCPAGCGCKKKSATATVATGTVCTTGTCAGWPPRNIVR